MSYLQRFAASNRSTNVGSPKRSLGKSLKNKKSSVKSSKGSSRVGSDDESGGLEDWNSDYDSNDLYDYENITNPGSKWESRLKSHIDHLTNDYKSSSTLSRETALSDIMKILSCQYCLLNLEKFNNYSLFITSIGRCIKHSKSNNEKILALKIFSILSCIDPENCDLYDEGIKNHLIERILIGNVKGLYDKQFGDDTEDDVDSQNKETKVMDNDKDNNTTNQDVDDLNSNLNSALDLDAATNSNSNISAVKIAAAYSYGIIMYFSASLYQCHAAIEIFKKIIESDGLEAGCLDDENLVSASINSLSLILSKFYDENSQISTINYISQEVLPCLEDQLHSTSINVRLSAGKAIAIIYEIFYEAYKDELDSSSESFENSSTVEIENPSSNVEDLIELLSELSSESNKKISKNSRKEQHSLFRDVISTVAAISDAIDRYNQMNNNNKTSNNPDNNTFSTVGNLDLDLYEDSKSAASAGRPHIILKFSANNSKSSNKKIAIKVNSWCKLIRLENLRRLLSNGFQSQFSKNENVRIALGYHGHVYPDIESSADTSHGLLEDDSLTDSRYDKHINKLSKKERDNYIKKSRNAKTDVLVGLD